MIMIAPKLTGRERDDNDMHRLIRGDASALESLMERHKRPLFHAVQRLLRDGTESADVVEETFLRVYQNRHGFGFRCGFSTWLYTIAINLARDHLRRRKRQPQFVSLDFSDEADDAESDEHEDELIHPGLIPSQKLQSKESFQSLEEALADLPEKLRVTLLLAAFDGCSQAEIAKQFHCTVKTVEMRLFHARRRMRNGLRRFEIV